MVRVGVMVRVRVRRSLRVWVRAMVMVRVRVRPSRVRPRVVEQGVQIASKLRDMPVITITPPA